MTGSKAAGQPAKRPAAQSRKTGSARISPETARKLNALKVLLDVDNVDEAIGWMFGLDHPNLARVRELLAPQAKRRQ